MAFPGILFRKEHRKRCYQCCKCCEDQCNNDFKKVLDLKNSGLAVYIYHKCKEKKPLSEEKYDAIILFNTTNKHYKKSSFLSEIGQHNVQCFKCKNIIQRVRNLLAEIKCIKGNETIGVCDYCKQANISNCKRCEFNVSKFMTSNSNAQEAIIQYLITWVRKVMISLQFSVEGCISKFNLNVRDNCEEELQRLLNELESPLSTRQPDYFKTIMNKVMTSLQSILEGFLYKLNARDASVEELQRLLNEFKAFTTQTTYMRHPDIERFPIIEEIKSLDNIKVMELLEKLMSKFSNESEILSKDSHTTATNLLNTKDSTKIIKKTSYDNISFEENKNSELRSMMHELNKSKGNENIPTENKSKKSRGKSGIKSEKGEIKPEKDLSKHTSSNKIKGEKSTIIQKDKISKVKGKIIDDKINVKLLNKRNNKEKDETKDKDSSKEKVEKGGTEDKVSSKVKKDDEHDEEKKVQERILKNMQKEDKKKLQHKKEKPLPNIKVQSMLDLPIHNDIELVDASSSSVIECADIRVDPNVMIKRQHIIPLNPHYGKQDGSTSPVQYQVLNSISDTLLELKSKSEGQSIRPVDTSYAGVRSGSLGIRGRYKPQQKKSHRVPLLYHVHKNISSHSLSKPSTVKNLDTFPSVTKQDKSLETSDKGVIKYQLSDPECITKGWTQLPSLRIMRRETSDKGVIKYQLSDPEYITKGWTQLPSLRIMRRINIYNMEPVNTANNWFERNKKSTILYNGSDETLADIDEFGYGKLYYKNGRVALDYYKAEEPNVKYRYVIYSDGEPKNGIPKPVTILGVFDGTGCGVVYDNYGHERLKYNQCEGIVIDKAIDSQCKWKWHNLNDPPVLETELMDTFSKGASTLKHIESENGNNFTPIKNYDVLAIELENSLKEKADKLLLKFRPLEIKSKTLKLNQQFSLQILRQTVIYLVFRERLTSLKFNLGLMLISNEIVGTETQNVADLFTPYNRFPPRSVSVENIQKMLGSARNFIKKRNVT